MNKSRKNGEPLRILVFYRNCLALGGVETYMYEQAKKLKEKGWLLVWVKKHPFAKMDNTMADVFDADSTIKWNGTLNLRKMKKLVGDGNAEIKIVTFSMYHFSLAEEFKKKFKLCPVDTFYFVSHYMGEAMFFEENHTGEAQEKVRCRMAQIVQRMHDHDNIRYFNIKHIEKMTANYGYKISAPDAVFVPPRESEKRVFDIERCRKLAARERFNLLTVTRFDFPHKGYVLGLINAYAQLKERYPNLELTIVGYGRDTERVKEEISKLSEAVQSGIRLVGKVSPGELVEYYNDANLNISVASSCSQGARNGTLSIPARHYDYNCEVYGFFPESKRLTVSEEKGYSALPYIEQVLNMSNDEYCEKCKDSFDTFRDDSVALRKSMEEITNVSEETIPDQDIRYIKRQELRRELRSKCRGVHRLFKKILKR